MDPRAELYKRRLGDAPYEICIERARLVTGAYRRTEGQPPATRAAKAFEQIVRHVTCSVLPEERIAGNRTSKVLGTVLPVERGDVNVILELELDALLARPERPFHIEPEDRRELVREILPWWRGRTLRERKNALLRRAGLVTLPALGPRALIERRRALDLGRLGRVVTPPGARPIAALRGLWGVLHNNPGLATNVFDVQGHLILGHCNVLRKGFRGIREEAGRRLAEGRATLDSEGRAFLDAVIRSTEAMRELGHRMAEACVRAASAAPEPGRRRELLDMAARCRHLPWEPPESFVEAVQALWLTQVGGLLAYGSPAILAAGRLDQHLVPYYLEDLRAGRITEGEASGLLEELLVKLGTNLMVLPHVGAQTGNELGSDSAAVTVGGLTPEGEDASNPLTFKILEAFENVRSTGNSFAIRLSERSKPELWRAALATFRKTSGAALHNDDVLVLALQRAGYSIAAARSYGVVGCVEPAGDGDTFGCTSGNDVSLVAALEMALLDGRLRILGRRLGPRTGDPRCFRSFEELLRAFERQVAHLIDRVVHAVSLKDRVYRETLPCPLVSSTLSGCVERARDMTAGGADYDFGSVSGRGFGTAVSSLAAVRWAVFETRQVTMAELLDALGRNFAGDKAIGRRLGGGEAHWRRVARGEAQGQRSSGDDAQGKRVAGDEAQGRSSAGEGANGRRLAGDEARGRRSAGDEAQGWRFANGEVQGRSSTGEGANGRRFVNDEALRQTLARRAPAYGADHGAADELARRVAGFFCERVSSYRNIRGGPFRPGFFSYGMHVVEGLVLGATPDGRRAGEPVSNSFSPTNGSEREGLLGVLRSVTRVDHRQVSNGLAVNVKLPPSVLESEEDLDRMVALVKGYFDLGGQELSPNVVSSETLRQAQANPEAYRDLVVRVSGYSACFTDLGRPLQDEIISRTELIP